MTKKEAIQSVRNILNLKIDKLQEPKKVVPAPVKTATPIPSAHDLSLGLQLNTLVKRVTDLEALVTKLQKANQATLTMIEQIANPKDEKLVFKKSKDNLKKYFGK
ncbi:MAG TPA: hypothetical protein VK588_09710 [Chitinophagaceae bacterium]|nr:hypothetical protein [Chitinophagaceae bacterium]